jgi:hypothetical protein
VASTGPVPDSSKKAATREPAADGAKARTNLDGNQGGVGLGAISALQGQAGNRAVSQMMTRARQPVQRLVKTKPSDLDSFTDTAKRFVGGKPNSDSPDAKLFGEIRQLLTSYRKQAETKASNANLQSRQLEHIDDLCAKYITSYGKDQKSRAKVLSRLQDDIVKERATLSKSKAMDIYQESVYDADPDNSNKAPGTQPTGGTDQSESTRFKGLTGFGKMGATDHTKGIPIPGYQGPDRTERIKALQAKYGLTDAEVSAITIYSAGDFSYINPVTANSSSWLAGQQAKERKGKSPEAWASLSDKTVKEEGGLHAGMAVKGLEKLKPYKGPTYRGARFTPEEFHKQFTPGKTTTFGALGSSSKDTSIALKFAYFLASGSVADPEKSVGVLTTVVDSGGRDVSGIAMVQEEAEVLILPGTTFEVVSVDRVKDPDSKYSEAVAAAKKAKKPLPTEFYAVRIKRVRTPSSAKAPVTKPLEVTARTRKTPWQAAAPTPAGNPFALPTAPGTLGLDRKRSDRATDLNMGDLQKALKKMEDAHDSSADALAALDPERHG